MKMTVYRVASGSFSFAAAQLGGPIQASKHFRLGAGASADPTRRMRRSAAAHYRCNASERVKRSANRAE
jgi:hypothetical protein